MLRVISCVALTAALLCTQGCSQETNGAGNTKDQNMFATTEYVSKGGLGMINTNLLIDLKSAKNELVWSGLDRWTGQAATAPEVAIFFEGRVWSPQALPNGFDISKAIIISFE